MGGEKEAEDSMMTWEKNPSIHIQEGTSKLGSKESAFRS